MKYNHTFKFNDNGKLIVEKVELNEDATGMMTSAPYMQVSLTNPTSNMAAYGVWSGYIGPDKKPIKRKHKMFYNPKDVIDFTKNDNWIEQLEDYKD